MSSVTDIFSDPLGTLFGVLDTMTEPSETPFPQPDDPEVEKKRQLQLFDEARRRGRKSTILTGGLGLQDEAEVRKASLLGG